MTLGNRIKQQRQSAQLTQEQLAERVGVSRQAVAKWERDVGAPGTENLIKLSEVFGLSLDELLGRPSEVPAAPPMPDPWAGTKKALRTLRRRALLALGVLAVYVLVHLLGRVVGALPKDYTVLGWLTDWQNKYYLPGWLQTSHLFHISAVLGALLCLLGKPRAALATIIGYVLGLLFGEIFGVYEPGVPYGHGHYGWAIWGGIFLASIPAGFVWEHLHRKNKKTAE